MSHQPAAASHTLCRCARRADPAQEAVVLVVAVVDRYCCVLVVGTGSDEDEDDDGEAVDYDEC